MYTMQIIFADIVNVRKRSVYHIPVMPTSIGRQMRILLLTCRMSLREHKTDYN